MIEPWDVNRASVLNLGYRRELQLFGIEGVMASNDEFLVDNAGCSRTWQEIVPGPSLEPRCVVADDWQLSFL